MTYPYNSIPSNNPQNFTVSTPVGLQSAARDPTPQDNTFVPGWEWQNTVTGEFFKCESSTIAGAVWIPFLPGAVHTLTGNSGGPVFPDVADNINVVGDGVGITITGNPGTHTLTASLIGGGANVQRFTTNIAGPVVPAAGTINLNASTSTFTDGTVANTVKTEVQGANHALFVGRGPLIPATTIGTGTLGQALASGGPAADPVFGTLGVVGGGTGDATFPNVNSVLFTGTTATGALQAPPTGVLGDILTSNGPGILPTWQPPGAFAFTTINVQFFNGTSTYFPTAGMLYCIVECLGGGGGGGGVTSPGAGASGGGGGGAGGYSRISVSAAVVGASQIVTIGAGGVAGVAGGTGGTGGTTTFGAIVTATGGAGGLGLAFGGGGGTGAAAGGAGGAGAIGTSVSSLAITASSGSYGAGVFSGGANLAYGGSGGSGYLGGAATNVTLASGGQLTGNNATSYGGGGNGGCGLNGGAYSAGGGAGFSGLCIVTEFI